MAVVKIELCGKPVDGQHVTFKAPCDCSNVTALKIYYPDGETKTSMSFKMRDAHNKDLAGIGNLFTKNAYVHAILNVSDKLAFLMNANTNSYIEGRFPKQASDIGAVPVIDARSSEFDMDVILKSGEHCAFYKTNSTTLNTPYAKGVTKFTGATILSAANTTSYGVQYALVNGDIMYTRRLNNGTIGDWNTGFLPLTGGTVTDDVTIKTADYPALKLENTNDTARATLQSYGNHSVLLELFNVAGDTSNRRAIVLRDSSNDISDIKKSLLLRDTVNGANPVDYAIYGEHNKPTAKDIGLGNVQNVSTNDQTPTYTVATSNTVLASGEKLSVAMGKIAKAVSSLISHLSNKQNPHSVTAAQAGAAPTAHASTKNTYGLGSSENYGHVKLSDSASTASGSGSGVAATPTAVKTVYDLANSVKDLLTGHTGNKQNPHGVTAAQVGALPTAGGTLTGESIWFNDGLGRFYSGQYLSQMDHCGAKKDLINRSSLMVAHSTDATGLMKAATLRRKINDVQEDYRLFGEHNKPSGTYTGNGATSRTIATGGVGKLMIFCGGSAKDDTFSPFFIVLDNNVSCFWQPQLTEDHDGGYYFFDDNPYTTFNSDGTITLLDKDLNVAGHEYFYFYL